LGTAKEPLTTRRLIQGASGPVKIDRSRLPYHWRVTQPVPPSISATAFSCPHCGAYTTQSWMELRGSYLGSDRRVPLIPDAARREKLARSGEIPKEQKEALLAHIDRRISGLVFLDAEGEHKSRA